MSLKFLRPCHVLSAVYTVRSHTHMYVMYTCFLTTRRSKHTSSKFISIFIVKILHTASLLKIFPTRLSDYRVWGPGGVDGNLWHNKQTNNARIYRPSFRANNPKTRAFWACFRENWVYKFGYSWILNDISRNFLLGNRKKIAKFLMRTFTYRSTFLYGCRI